MKKILEQNFLWSSRHLIWVLFKKELHIKYGNNTVSFLWILLNPLVMLGIYTLIFSNILKVKWTSVGGGPIEFGANVFIGILIFNFFNENISIAPTVFVNNRHLIKKLNFHIQILALVPLISLMLEFILGTLIWIILCTYLVGFIPLSLGILPVILGLFFLFAYGLLLLLGSLGIFLGDLKQIVKYISSLLLFTSPIFYPLSAIPENIRLFLIFSPITFCIETTRQIMFERIQPDTAQLVVYAFECIFSLLIGLAVFNKTKKAFADVI
jgi:lipopolysaccharide transport system permease protein